MQRKIWLMAIGVVILLILINNTIYYFMTKNSLEEALRHELLSLGKQIELSVEQTRIGSDRFEEQIGRELRAAAIAAQYALDPDIENVTNEQLDELRDKLDIRHLSLLKKIENDIILYRSTDKSQIGKSTKDWVPWYKYFEQLFERKNVEGEWLGQTLPNFWSGPFEASSTDVYNVYKWGYYHDGTTNYIIDPYVHFEKLKEFNELTGVDRLLKDLADGQESIIEIMGVNPETFPNGRKSDSGGGEVKDHVVQRAVLFGEYNVQLHEDVQAVQEAYKTNDIVTMDRWVDGNHVYKMFIPVSVKNKGIAITDEAGNPMDSYVLSIVSDYNLITSKLNKQFLDLGLIIILATAISLFIAITIMRYFKQSQNKAISVAQETYVEEINSLFLSIRAQRHDFINHVQTIHSLAALAKHKELVEYTKELTNDIRIMNDIINIGNPAIAALIRSKISQAEMNAIQFTSTFQNVKMAEMGAKTLDMNRILGNLIDNAFDEVMKYEEDERIVELMCSEDESGLMIKVSNRCEHAEQLLNLPLFKAGHSTKKQQHQGLGLSIVKEIAEKYRGEVKYIAEPEYCITFIVKIPT